MQKTLVLVFSFLVSVSALAAEVGALMIFAPDGRVLTRQEVVKIYEATKECEAETSAALPELKQNATRGNETAKAQLTVAHSFCLYKAIDDILYPPAPEK